MSIGTQSINEFVRDLREKTPAPGGGAAAAVTGRLGAALAGMVLRYSADRKGVGEDSAAVMRTVDASIDDLLARLAPLADEDAEAYRAVRAARELPKDEGELASERSRQLKAALEAAADVPLRTARLCADGLEMFVSLVDRLNPHLAPDTALARSLLRAAVLGALANVRANLSGMDEAAAKAREDQVSRTLARLEGLPMIAVEEPGMG